MQIKDKNNKKYNIITKNYKIIRFHFPNSVLKYVCTPRGNSVNSLCSDRDLLLCGILVPVRLLEQRERSEKTDHRTYISCITWHERDQQTLLFFYVSDVSANLSTS